MSLTYLNGRSDVVGRARFSLYLCLLNALLHFENIADHLEGIADDIDLALAVVDDLNGHLHDLHTELIRPENALKIEGL